MPLVVNKTVAWPWLCSVQKNRLKPSYHHQQAPHHQPARVSPHGLACILEICSVCHSGFDFLEAGHCQGLNCILFNDIVAFKKLAFIFSDIVALMCSLLFLNDLALPLGTTLTYATSSSALTRPRSSGTLSRRGEGCA